MNIKLICSIVVVVGLLALTTHLVFKDKASPVHETNPADLATPANNAAPQDPSSQNAFIAPQKQAKKNQPNNASFKKSKADSDVFEASDDNPEYETFYDRYQDIVARRAGLQFDPEELYKEMQKPSAWETLDEAPSDYDLSDAELNDGRSFITFSALKLESLAPGDTLQISIENDDINFEAKISEVRSEGEGESVTWYGESNTHGSTDTITITQADGLTVGGIFTDQGLYQLEVKNGRGFIVNNATLFRHGEDQQVYVPPEYIENPPNHYVELEAETFGVSPTHNH